MLNIMQNRVVCSFIVGVGEFKVLDEML